MYAVDHWDADIICMPFGFSELTSNLDCIQRAISHAHHKQVILMAAAANHGGLDDVAYPANQSEVICINSTDGEGNKSHFNPSPEGHEPVSVLGEAVPSHWPQTGAARKSGTSFAAPVAAGIAAVIMDYLNLRKGSWTEEQKFYASKIKRRKGMVSVLQKNLSAKRDKFQFLRPWELFNNDFQTIDTLLWETLRRA